MSPAIARDVIYCGRRFSPEIIELCVRWYITYRLSYRDLVSIVAERGVTLTHTTIMRWVLRYVPEYERRWAQFAHPPGPSWRMDETAVSVRGGRHYRYRAVDKDGKSVASLLSRDRSIASAQAFFRLAVTQDRVPWPRKINLDGNSATHRALRLLGDEDQRWRGVEVRASRYLNNVVEQDHRAIKQRCAPMLGLKTFHSAAVTLAGIELAHRIRKGQYMTRPKVADEVVSLKDQWDCALASSDAANDRNLSAFPAMHQISGMPRIAVPSAPSPRQFGMRYPRKLAFGGSLYLLVKPKGGRYWHYYYRYGRKQKTLALGCYPDVPFGTALVRHRAARELLAAGIDPSIRRKELRQISARFGLAA